MRAPDQRYIYLSVFLFTPIALWLFSCSNNSPATSKPDTDTLAFLNHSDSARYVGMNTCKTCHPKIYESFIQTGMGRSFDLATRHKSAAGFKNALVKDSFSGFNYQAFWQRDSLFIREFRSWGKDTLHQRIEQVNYIIGSGQHTNSHLHRVNGYLSQMPMTFYTQKQTWDLPPGFEHGVNTRFARKIGLECMSCHNAYPDFVMGSENKYNSVPQGIDCERCHGPGSIHVAAKQNGIVVDTSKYADRTIVNPAKLPIERQFDICQRCHLQGNTILKNGRSFYDFKPGQTLSHFMTVFLSRYSNADDEFIMASHADRLRQSACYIKSLPTANELKTLKPYKNALTCVSCHNPHLSVKFTGKDMYNNVCLKCHNETPEVKNNCKRFVNKASDCVSCHMPPSGSTDIPHVSVHDHYIRRPVDKQEKKKIKEFMGLYAVNEKNPDLLTRAKAWLNQYEKFEQNKSYLDSAYTILKRINNKDERAGCLVQYYFLSGQLHQVENMVSLYGSAHLLNKVFVHKSYANEDAWACYRVGQSLYTLAGPEPSLVWYAKAVELAPYNLEFRNKYGNALAAANKIKEAKTQFEFVLAENPGLVAPYTNLGYLALTEGKTAEALRLYLIAEKLDPDYEPLLLNLAAYYRYMNDKQKTRHYLQRVLRKNPANATAKQLLQQSF